MVVVQLQGIGGQGMNGHIDIGGGEGEVFEQVVPHGEALVYKAGEAGEVGDVAGRGL